MSHTKLTALRRQIDADTLPLGVFNDPDLFALEQERIFARSWCFLGHASEIPEPGDFVVRYIAQDGFIVVRDDDNTIRVLLNACRHRGRQLCRAERGRTSTFVCPYHGWVYRRDGALHAAPHADDLFGAGRFDVSTRGLVSAPQVAVWRDWIFACLDPAAPALQDYLGDAVWYLDFYTNKTPGGLAVHGSPQRWVIEADWKLGADNFIGDGYHTAVTHGSTVRAGILPAQTGDFLLDGVQVVMDHFGVGMARQDPLFNSLAYPPPMIESLRAALSDDQQAMLDRGVSLPTHATLFPNLSFLNAPGAHAPDQPPAPYLTLRTWRPLGPGRTEVWSWLLIERDAPDAFRAASHRAYTLSFGPSGTLEQDDAENWSTISSAARGTFGRQLALDYAMGQNHLEPIADWPGPGAAYPLDYTEFAQRAFWRRWIDMLEQAV